MKRVLVTGATGFIGRQTLAPLVAQGFDVHAVARTPAPTATEDGVTWHSADLLDPTQTERVLDMVRASHLLHFAWYTVHREYWTSAENVRWVEASLRLIQRFAELDGRRAVLAGTCAEYDWTHGFCSEGVTPLSPSTLYGTAKDALRRVVEAYAGEAGLSLAWGRIFFLFGPHEHPERLVASVARALATGEPALSSHGRQIRDFLYVTDVAEAFATLVASDVRGAVNIGAGEPRTIASVVETLAQAAARPELLRLGALGTPHDEPPLVVADIRRLRDEVGWTPSRTLDERLAETLEWWGTQLLG